MAHRVTPTDFPRDVYRARRAALVARGLDRASVFFAGEARARNYAANRFRFRAHSGFLHFVGHPIEGAVLVVDAEPTLYVPVPSVDDVVWHGPSPTLDELAEALGLSVRARADMSLDARRAACVPSFDAATLAEQRESLSGEPDQDAIVALSEALVELRLRHDGHALRELQRAANVTALAHRAGMSLARPGRRVSEVRAMMEAVIAAHGMTTAYGSIVTPHGEILHAGEDARTIAHDAMILADVGAESPYGYAADLTRSYPASGRFDGAGRALYEAVLRTQRAAIAGAVPGVRYRALHEQAMSMLAAELVDLGILVGDPVERAFDGSVALFFPHGVGHLLGLDVHDMEDLGDRAGYPTSRERSADPGLRYLRLDRDLERDMVVTLEPGLYFVPALIDPPDVRTAFAGRVDWGVVDAMRHVRGIRIEDDVHVTNRGPSVLTRRAPKRVFGIESIVGSGVDWDRMVAAAEAGFDREDEAL